MSVWKSIRSLFGPSGRRSRTGTYPAVGSRDAAPFLRDRRKALTLRGFLFCVLLAAACALVLDYGVLPPPYKLGGRAPVNKLARVDFDFISTRNQEQAAREALPVFRPVEDWSEGILKDLNLFCEIVEKAETIKQATGEVSILNRSEVGLVEALYRYRHEDKEKGAKEAPDKKEADDKKKATEKEKEGDEEPKDLSTELISPLEGALKGLARNGVLDSATLKNKVWGKPAILRIEPSNKPREIEARELRDIKKATGDIDRSLLQMREFPEDLRKELLRYFHDHLKPSLEFDEKATLAESRRQGSDPANALTPYRAGQLLVAADTPMNDETLRLLKTHDLAVKAKSPWRERLVRFGGHFAIAATMVLFCFIAFRRTRVTPMRARPLIMLGLSVLAVVTVARLLMINGLPVWLTPVAFVAMVTSLAFSPSASFPVTLAIAVLCGFAGQHSVMTVLALLMGGAVSAIPAKQLQDRWDLIRFGAIGGLAQALTMLGLTLLEPAHLATDGVANYPQLLDTAYGFANPIGCSLLLLGSLPLIEYAFGTVTNIRLMELSDQNQPALRRIMIEAPGTWAHTLQVASLCEPAAEAIGANPRLVRAGVYYHDLGKTLKPEYYVENQQQAELLHKRLSPTVSTLIILSHVKDGIVLAREYGLPQQILSFIPEHHGTTLIKYFYHQAKSKAEEEGREEAVQEDFFRYPGPKPQSRETAIVMLADTAEAASRTLESPSATRLRSFIHEMIMQKMLDGQLDECDLTFRELEIVEETFLRVLISRFHNRIRYPGQEAEPTRAVPAADDTAEQKAVPLSTKKESERK